MGPKNQLTAYPTLRPLGKSGAPPRTCQFIHGDVPPYPDEPDWCGAPLMKRAEDKPRSPYCEEHHGRCYAGTRFMATGKRFTLAPLKRRTG